MTTSATLSISSRAGATREATTAITLVITSTHMERGRREDCGRCPIALGFGELAPGAECIVVSSNAIEFWYDDELYHLDLPIAAQDFVANFDNGGPAEPFYFDLPLPAHLVNTPGFLCSDESEYAPVDVTNGCGL